MTLRVKAQHFKNYWEIIFAELPVYLQSQSGDVPVATLYCIIALISCTENRLNFLKILKTITPQVITLSHKYRYHLVEINYQNQQQIKKIFALAVHSVTELLSNKNNPSSLLDATMWLKVIIIIIIIIIVIIIKLLLIYYIFIIYFYYLLFVLLLTR